MSGSTHCNALGKKCWEQHHLAYFGEWPSRVMTADILIAVWTAEKLIERFFAEPDLIENTFLVKDALDTILDLRGRQWREMVRQPFDFPIHREQPTSTTKKPNDHVSLEDLGL